MKKSKYHIIHAWLLLFCFIAGQCIVYTHQHHIKPGITSSCNKQAQQTVKEKCQLCDAMHHTVMLLTKSNFFTHNAVADHVYQQGDYNFISIALILSPGRAPPSVS